MSQLYFFSLRKGMIDEQPSRTLCVKVRANLIRSAASFAGSGGTIATEASF